MEWQPIETAPKDGGLVLLWLDPPIDTNDTFGSPPVDYVHVVVGWWQWPEWQSAFQDESAADTDGGYIPRALRIRPTHWMPLPRPPTNI